jgi:RimJ/RimL family protein N-acetyltransferase
MTALANESHGSRVSISVRPLGRADWRTFRRLRIEALRREPGAYCVPLESALGRSDEEWQELVDRFGQQLFVLFDGEHSIGIGAALTYRDDPTGRTAELAMSYIKPEHRGRGLSRLLYAARLEWIRAQPTFHRAIVSHRASNEASRRAIERHGFVLIHIGQTRWPDGALEEEWHYELQLRPGSTSG